MDKDKRDKTGRKPIRGAVTDRLRITLRYARGLNSRRARPLRRFRHEFLHAPIQRVGDVELGFRADRHEVRLAELAESLALLADHAQNLALQIELEDLP